MARTDAEQVAYTYKCQATFNTVTSDRKNMFSINFPNFFIVKAISYHVKCSVFLQNCV